MDQNKLIRTRVDLNRIFNLNQFEHGKLFSDWHGLIRIGSDTDFGIVRIGSK